VEGGEMNIFVTKNHPLCFTEEIVLTTVDLRLSTFGVLWGLSRFQKRKEI
jgi:hypothetical protein